MTDMLAGLLGPALILLGVLSARRSGRPRWIDMSRRELVTAMLPEEILLSSLGAPDPLAHRRAIAAAADCPSLAEAADSDLAAAVEQWSRGRSRHETMADLQAAGVPAAAVTRGHELHHDPFFQAIDFFKQVPLPDQGTELQHGWIVRMDGPGAEIRHRAPHVGEHTADIMRSRLGYRQPDLERLLSAGVIAQASVGKVADQERHSRSEASRGQL